MYSKILFDNFAIFVEFSAFVEGGEKILDKNVIFVKLALY